MSFTSALTRNTVIGNIRMHYGTFGQAATDTGGTIQTGLTSVENFQTTCAITSSTISGGAVTMVTPQPGATQNGYWMALGL